MGSRSVTLAAVNIRSFFCLSSVAMRVAEGHDAAMILQVYERQALCKCVPAVYLHFISAFCWLVAISTKYLLVFFQLALQEQKNYSQAEVLYLSAKKPESAIKMYKDAGMWYLTPFPFCCGNV